MTYLRSVRIRNFKAIRHSGLLKLGPLTVFIGNNGVGKSSLMEALQMFQSVVLEGVDTAFSPFNGVEHVRHKSARSLTSQAMADPISQNDPVEIYFRAKVPDSGMTRAQMRINQRAGLQYIQHERYAIGKEEALRDFSSAAKTFGEGRSILNPLSDLRLLYESVERWQFVALHPDIMGRAQPQQRVRGRGRLARDGSNLGGFVLDLAERAPEAFNGVVEAMQYVLPFAADIRPVMPASDIDRRVYLELAEKNFRVPSWLFSSGTLRLLAILCLLRDPDPPPVLFIEELENGLDPRTIGLLVEELRNAIELGHTQVIATTHSPYLLDLLALEHLVMVERDEHGEPKFFRPEDDESLQAWKDRFSPGQLYLMDRFRAPDKKGGKP